MNVSGPIGKVLLVSAILALGIGAAWCAVAGWTIGVVAAALRTPADHEQLLVSIDGKPLIVRTSRDAGAAERVLTLDGQEVKTKRQDLLYPQYLHHPDQNATWGGPDWSYRITSANDGGTPAVYWYLIHDGRHNGRAYGVGYHAKTKMIVGYFGRNGFSNALPPGNERFEIRGNGGLSGATTTMNVHHPYFSRASDALIPLLADDKLWVIDVAKKEVKPLLDCPSAEQVGSAWRLPKEPPQPNPDEINQQAQLITPSDVFLRQSDSIVILDHRTGKHATFPLPADARHDALAAFLLGDGNLLLFVWDLRDWRDGQEVVWIAANGEITKRQTVQLAGHVGSESEALIGWLAALVAPAPVASGVILAGGPFAMVQSGQADSYSAALAKLLRAIWPSVLMVLLIGTVCATAAYRRQRRFGLPNPAAWAVFAFVLGIPGWIAYRFHRTWPAMEDCPACCQPAPRDRSHCLDCGAAFPPPPLKGIEVFAA